MNDQVKENLLASGEFVNQVASLVGVIADKLPSNGTLPENIESFVTEKVEESMSDQDVDIGVVVEQKIEEYDMYDKVDGVLDNYDLSDKIDDFDMSDKIDERLSEFDWAEKVEQIVDDKLFSFVQSLMLKQFDADTTEWLDRLRQRAVSDHLAANAKAESTEDAPVQV